MKTRRRHFLQASVLAAAPSLATAVEPATPVSPEPATSLKPTVVRTAEVMQREPQKHLWTLHQSATSRTNLVQMKGQTTRHLHPDAEHSLYVIHGEVRASVGEEEFDLRTGDYISIPAGVPHSYLVSTREPALLLSLDAPAYDPAKTIRVEPAKK